jgi:hypothetical protein
MESGAKLKVRKISPRSLVQYLEGHTLDSAAQSFNAWTVNLRLSPEYNRSLDALLKTGPFKSYAVFFEAVFFVGSRGSGRKPMRAWDRAVVAARVKIRTLTGRRHASRRH